MQEEDLYNAWFYHARVRRALPLQGTSLDILNPGILNTKRGPDILAARFKLDDVVYQGSVEFHIKSGDWYRHQHHLDRAYSGVLLHLVARRNSIKEIRHELSGQSIPTFVLTAIPENKKALHPARLCVEGKSKKNNLILKLQDLALIRLENQVRRFCGNLSQYSPGQVFYKSLLRVLGYPGNSAPFEQLAYRFSRSLLSSLPGELAANENMLYALFAGQAGFLEGCAADSKTNQLQSVYKALRHLFIHSPLENSQWTYVAIRPANHPHFRLAGWVGLFCRNNTHPFGYLDNLLSGRREADAVLKSINAYFSVPVNGYWRNHFALGRKIKGGQNRVYFGPARIREFIINLILPFFAARALLSGSPGFYDYIREFYLQVPGPGLYNIQKKNMPWLQGAINSNSAFINQALLYLESQYCRRAACNLCPLGRVPGKSVDKNLKNI